MSSPKVFAISGYKFSGKDTCANFLVESAGFVRVSFADPLKNMVSEYFNVSRNYLDDPAFKEKPLLQYPVPAADKFTETVSKFMVKEFRTSNEFPPDAAHIRVQNGILQAFTNEWENLYHTPRSLAILLGSSMRTGTTDFWVKQAIVSIRLNSKNKHNNFVISDLRYKSEMKQLKEAFGNDLVTIRVNRFDTSPSQDPSERDLDDAEFDFVVDNKGTLDNLFNQMSDILEVYL